MPYVDPEDQRRVKRESARKRRARRPLNVDPSQDQAVASWLPVARFKEDHPDRFAALFNDKDISKKVGGAAIGDMIRFGIEGPTFAEVAKLMQ